MSATVPNDAFHNWVTPYAFVSGVNFQGKRIDVTTAASAPVQLQGAGNSVVLTNIGNPLPTEPQFACYVCIADTATAATNSCYPILPGTQVVLSLPSDGTGKTHLGMWISAIGDGATTLLANVGYGV